MIIWRDGRIQEWVQLWWRRWVRGLWRRWVGLWDWNLWLAFLLFILHTPISTVTSLACSATITCQIWVTIFNKVSWWPIMIPS